MNRGTRWERAKMSGAELVVSAVEHGVGVIEALLGGGRRPEPVVPEDPDWVRQGGYVCVHGYRLLVPGDCVHPDCPPRS